MSTWHLTEADDPELLKLVGQAVAEFRWPEPDLSTGAAWLYGDPGEDAVGFATFRPVPNYNVGGINGWELTHVWLGPDARRQGALSVVWRERKSMYGAFSLFEPNLGMESAARALDARP